MKRLREWIFEKSGIRKPTVQQQPAQPAPHLQPLFKAKERAREDVPAVQPLPVVDKPVPQPPAPVQIAEPAKEPERVPQEKPAQPPEAASSTTSSLLARKKAMRKKSE